MATYAVVIPRWRPALLNELRGHWARGHRRKAADAHVVAVHLALARVPPAAGPRAVAVTIADRWHRRPDPDAPLKSLLDALVRAGALRDDSARWCRWSVPVFTAGPPATTITLTDLDPDGPGAPP
jgi:Holliday junction resolvase RusA-like endonuclease